MRFKVLGIRNGKIFAKRTIFLQIAIASKRETRDVKLLVYKKAS